MRRPPPLPGRPPPLSTECSQLQRRLDGYPRRQHGLWGMPRWRPCLRWTATEGPPGTCWSLLGFFLLHTHRSYRLSPLRVQTPAPARARVQTSLCTPGHPVLCSYTHAHTHTQSTHSAPPSLIPPAFRADHAQEPQASTDWELPPPGALVDSLCLPEYSRPSTVHSVFCLLPLPTPCCTVIHAELWYLPYSHGHLGHLGHHSSVIWHPF